MKMMHPRKHRFLVQYRPQQWAIRLANLNLRQLAKMADLTVYFSLPKISQDTMKHPKDYQGKVRVADRK